MSDTSTPTATETNIETLIATIKGKNVSDFHPLPKNFKIEGIDSAFIEQLEQDVKTAHDIVRVGDQLADQVTAVQKEVNEAIAAAKNATSAKAHTSRAADSLQKGNLDKGTSGHVAAEKLLAALPALDAHAKQQSLEAQSALVKLSQLFNVAAQQGYLSTEEKAELDQKLSIIPEDYFKLQTQTIKTGRFSKETVAVAPTSTIPDEFDSHAVFDGIRSILLRGKAEIAAQFLTAVDAVRPAVTADIQARDHAMRAAEQALADGTSQADANYNLAVKGAEAKAAEEMARIEAEKNKAIQEATTAKATIVGALTASRDESVGNANVALADAVRNHLANVPKLDM